MAVHNLRAVRVWRESGYERHSYYEVGRPLMPRIPDVHLQSVAFIYPSEETARAGEQPEALDSS